MKKQTPEGVILNQVRDYLRLKGWYVIRIQQGLGCHKGISDLIIIGRNRVVFVEVKAPSGELSEYQKAFSFNVRSGGAEYIVVRSVEDLAGYGI